MPKQVEKLSAAQQKAIAFMKGKSVRELGELGASIGALLAELTTELADAKLEGAHWKTSFEAVRDELSVIVAVAIKRLKADKRLVIGKDEYHEIVKQNVQLWCGGDGGVRIYELRERRKAGPVEDAVKGAINGTVLGPH